MATKQISSGTTRDEIREARVALVYFIIHKLKSNDSWCSLLHVQKTYYMAQEMLGIDLGYEFVRYKYGPYCFELTDEIDEARANLLIFADETSPMYGLSYSLARDVIEDLKYKDNNGYEYKNKINFIAEWFGKKQGRELELLTSVYMIMKGDLKRRAITKTKIKELQEWKPHFNEEQIKAAFQEVKAKQQEAEEFLKAQS